MPWRETSVMEERLRFVARLLEGEGMSEVCRAFGISRKTGYKIFNRYKDDGLEALTDRSRRPVRYLNQLPDPVEAMIVRLKKEKPYWGARKIRELLVKRLAGDVRIPAKSTVHAVLDRHGLVSQARKRNRANKAVGTQLSAAPGPNDLWCADFKGEFKLGTAILLPPDDHRPALALSSVLRGLRIDARTGCLRGLSAGFCRAGPAGRDPLRQRPALRQSQRALQSVKALGLVAQARHRPRAHPSRSPAGERPPRAHAPDAQEGSDEAAGPQYPAAADAFRRFRKRIQ